MGGVGHPVEGLVFCRVLTRRPFGESCDRYVHLAVALLRLILFTKTLVHRGFLLYNLISVVS